MNKEIVNDMLQYKGPFTKSVYDMCKALARLKSGYGNQRNKFSNACDCVAFIKVSDEKKYNKKKVVTCFKC